MWFLEKVIALFDMHKLISIISLSILATYK